MKTSLPFKSPYSQDRSRKGFWKYKVGREDDKILIKIMCRSNDNWHAFIMIWWSTMRPRAYPYDDLLCLIQQWNVKEPTVWHSSLKTENKIRWKQELSGEWEKAIQEQNRLVDLKGRRKQHINGMNIRRPRIMHRPNIYCGRKQN